MKKVFTIIVFFVLLAGMISCSSDDDGKSVGETASISIKYNGETIDFENVSVSETMLDMDQGKGLRLWGEKKFDNADHFQYYTLIDLKKDENGDYLVHKVDFGVNEQISPTLYNLELHYAYTTEPIVTPNFNSGIITDNDRINGSFSGTMLTIHTPNSIQIEESHFEFSKP